jgi:hypothetical protein
MSLDKKSERIEGNRKKERENLQEKEKLKISLIIERFPMNDS